MFPSLKLGRNAPPRWGLLRSRVTTEPPTSRQANQISCEPAEGDVTHAKIASRDTTAVISD